VPWFFVMRLMRRLRDEQSALEASQAAEARAAATAERGRLAREMHDVLAHSLSALALQLESSRLLARDRGTDAEIVDALDRAHHLAASGLEEARRAIAAARGEELPGPERLEALAAAFTEQSGLPVELNVSGEPRELASEVRLAIYRTAQEALTNIRRHATPKSVDVQLTYHDRQTILTVEDRGAANAPPPVSPVGSDGGYGLAGMRERAELLGGHLVAEPTASGFRVELSLPASPAIAVGTR
jgi:signal transduction histidine kinase